MRLLRRREHGDRTSAIAHAAHWLLVPIEIRPHVGTALAAGLAHEPAFDIGQPKIIRPRAAADGDRVAAALVGVNEQAARAPRR